MAYEDYGSYVIWIVVVVVVAVVAVVVCAEVGGLDYVICVYSALLLFAHL